MRGRQVPELSRLDLRSPSPGLAASHGTAAAPSGPKIRADRKDVFAEATAVGADAERRRYLMAAAQAPTGVRPRSAATTRTRVRPQSAAVGHRVAASSAAPQGGGESERPEAAARRRCPHPPGAGKLGAHRPRRLVAPVDPGTLGAITGSHLTIYSSREEAKALAEKMAEAHKQTQTDKQTIHNQQTNITVNI